MMAFLASVYGREITRQLVGGVKGEGEGTFIAGLLPPPPPPLPGDLAPGEIATEPFSEEKSGKCVRWGCYNGLCVDPACAFSPEAMEGEQKCGEATECPGEKVCCDNGCGVKGEAVVALRFLLVRFRSLLRTVHWKYMSRLICA